MNQMSTEVMEFLKEFAAEYERREQALHKVLKEQSSQLAELQKEVEVTRSNYAQMMENSKHFQTLCEQLSSNQAKIMSILSGLNTSSTSSLAMENELMDDIAQELTDNGHNSLEP